MKVLQDSGDVRGRYLRLLESDHTGVYHTLEWLDVFKALGHEIVFVEAHANTLLPFAQTGAGPTRRAFSLPYDTYGGPVHPKKAISFAEVAAALAAPTVRVVDYWARMAPTGGCEVESASAHEVILTAGYEAVHAAYTKRCREALRQAERRGVEVRVQNDTDGVDSFYRLYQNTTHKHDDLPMSRDFFDAVLDIMTPAGLADYYLAFCEGKVVAAHLILRDRHAAIDWAIGYDDDTLVTRSPNALIDRAIRDAALSGAQAFNLGASPSSGMGIIRFKESFGARQRVYRVLTRAGAWYKAGRWARKVLRR